MQPDDSPRLAELVGQVIVVDFRSPYVCLGTLVGWDTLFLEMADADLHDFRDSTATREIYIYDSARIGVRRNRARVLVLRSEIVAMTRLEDVAET
jgi:hypothetical protein